MHGLGDSAMGFADIFLDDGNRFGVVPPGCNVILPTAPVRPVSLNNGYEMTSWFDIYPMAKQVETMNDIYDRYD